MTTRKLDHNPGDRLIQEKEQEAQRKAVDDINQVVALKTKLGLYRSCRELLELYKQYTKTTLQLKDFSKAVSAAPSNNGQYKGLPLPNSLVEYLSYEGGTAPISGVERDIKIYDNNDASRHVDEMEAKCSDKIRNILGEISNIEDELSEDTSIIFTNKLLESMQEGETFKDALAKIKRDLGTKLTRDVSHEGGVSDNGSAKYVEKMERLVVKLEELNKLDSVPVSTSKLGARQINGKNVELDLNQYLENNGFETVQYQINEIFRRRFNADDKFLNREGKSELEHIEALKWPIKAIRNALLNLQKLYGISDNENSGESEKGLKSKIDSLKSLIRKTATQTGDDANNDSIEGFLEEIEVADTIARMRMEREIGKKIINIQSEIDKIMKELTQSAALIPSYETALESAHELHKEMKGQLADEKNTLEELIRERSLSKEREKSARRLRFLLSVLIFNCGLAVSNMQSPKIVESNEATVTNSVEPTSTKVKAINNTSYEVSDLTNDMNKELEELRNIIEENEKKISDLEDEIKGKNTVTTNAGQDSEKIRQLEATINRLNAIIDKISTERDNAEAKVDELKKGIKDEKNAKLETLIPPNPVRR